MSVTPLPNQSELQHPKNLNPNHIEIDPASLTSLDRYKILVGAVVPRPIAWVSTRSPAGIDNLAPYSFFNAVGCDPMLLLFCPANKPDGSEKDSLRNAKPINQGGSGEFVVNIVSYALAQAMNTTAASLPYETSEFEHAHIATAPCAKVRCARVALAPVSFECITHEIIRTNGTAPNAGNIVIGKVVNVWLAPGIATEQLHLDPATLDAIGRLGGSTYCTSRDRFDITRPGAGGG